MEPFKRLLFFRRIFRKAEGLNYIATETIPYFKECEPIVSQAGFVLVELQVVPQKRSVNVTVVIAQKDAAKDIGVADCSTVHHALKEPLLDMLKRSEDDLFIQVCSPGLDRNIKNAAEFAVFVGRSVRVWSRTASDWISGIIQQADERQVTLEREGGTQSI